MRKKFLFCCLISGTFFVTPLAYAVIPVIDTSNIRQQTLTYLEAVKNVINTAQQITLQVQELRALPNTVLNSYRSVLDSDLNIIKGVVHEATGVLNPLKNISQTWQETFKSAGEITKTNATSLRVASSNSNTIKALDQTNFDSMKIVKKSTTELEKSQERLKLLMQLNSTAEGQKQSGQIQNMILAEQAKIMILQNNIRAANAASQILYYQRSNQIDSNAHAIAEKNAESLKKFPNPVFKE